MSAFAIESGLVIAAYLLLYAAFSSRGARTFLERYLPQPKLRCPHCHEEVLQRNEATKYAYGMSARFESREDRCFLCPRCKK